MKGNRAWRALVLVCVMGVVVAACGSSNKNDNKTASGSGTTAASGTMTKIKIGVVPVVDVAPLYLGIKKGFFKDEGLDVTPVVAQGGAAIIPAVVNGDQEIGFSNIVSLLLGQTRNLPVQVISQGIQATDDPNNDTAAVAVPKDSPIKTVKDLQGKTIAINTLKNISELTVKAALAGQGVDVSTLKFVEVPLPDMVGQLQAHRVDAAGLVEPFVTTGKAAGDRTLIYDRVATDPKMTVATYFTSKKFLDAHPDTVDNFVKAMHKSLEYATSHPDEARDALADYTQIPPDVRAKVVLPLWQTDLNRASIDKINDLMVKYGISDKKADVDALIAKNAG